MSVITLSYKIEGFLKIYDPNNGEIFVDKKNRFEARALGRTVTKLSTCDTDTI